jgi:S-DNA-T family DNA segregation ATPase FtsK/SpoIIIE
VQDIELKVRERVEEEKADSIDREADPDEDLPYEFPPLDLLDEPDDDGPQVDHDELETNKRILLDKLDTYNIQIDDINAVVGPTVTLYELTPAPGVKISRITSLEDDLAMAMAARGIRIIAPIPGKSAVGVEIPNRHRELVRIRDIIGTVKFRDTEMELPVALGKTIEGEVYLQDLTKMPHLLVAGATGSGKSVGINALITGLLYACPPSHLKFVLIDPKKIELQQYKTLEGHYIAKPEDGEDVVITAFEDALGVLKSCEKEMERRYDLLSKASVRSIREYNQKLHDGALSDDYEHLPYIVVIVDELADLMMTAGKDIEGPVARLAQMARAVGIHLVLATQRPSVDVITGLIKANFPSRVAYQVASKIDARTILDQNGAEGLVGNGDLLYMNGSRIVRLQGPFVSIDEVDRLVAFVDEQPAPGPYILPPGDENETSALAEALGVEETDELFDEAARIIVQHQQGSVSLLQRKMAVGYTRAARIVDQLEEAGIVGPFVGSKARDVLVSDLEQLDAFLSTRDDDGDDA